VRALVTGAEGGIGGAICTRLEREGYDVVRLDLVNGFDAGDPSAWDEVPEVELACLNAGVITRVEDIRLLTDDRYREVLGVNVDGVVFGVRALAQRMQRGGAIVATASLAGLTDMQLDPIYALTKHAVVGFVRSVAPQLEARGIRVNAVCPGIVDTTMIDERREDLIAAGFPLLTPDDVADAVWRAATSEGAGEAWVVQPGREPLPFRYPGVPGPRTPGSEGLAPPF
jgi:NAD(P)-dependent dehydrogenase (short-subunit alcohol dehydrogenase family)